MRHIGGTTYYTNTLLSFPSTPCATWASPSPSPPPLLLLPAPLGHHLHAQLSQDESGSWYGVGGQTVRHQAPDAGGGEGELRDRQGLAHYLVIQLRRHFAPASCFHREKMCFRLSTHFVSPFHPPPPLPDRGLPRDEANSGGYGASTHRRHAQVGTRHWIQI